MVDRIDEEYCQQQHARGVQQRAETAGAAYGPVLQQQQDAPFDLRTVEARYDRLAEEIETARREASVDLNA